MAYNETPAMLRNAMFTTIKKTATKKADAVINVAQKVADFDLKKKIRIAIDNQIS